MSSSVIAGLSLETVLYEKNGSAQESDNLPERLAFSERWRLASLRR